MIQITTEKAAELLNDAEINYLADIYLACYGLNRSDRSYRRFKNAVVLVSSGVTDYGKVCRAIAELEQKSEKAVADGIGKTVNSLPRPAYKIFNETYSQPRSHASDNQTIQTLTMPPYEKPADVVLFLGTAFLYIRLINYNKFV
ncbi:MAG: hypothetical protein K2L54_00255 [Clostridiales bacterium]|nr:hypothetical protein [Clostridiales bacterium]